MNEPITDAELAAIHDRAAAADDPGMEWSYGAFADSAADVPDLLAEVDRLRAENDSTFADLLHYSHLHWEDCPLDAGDCYLCEGYERIRANARDRKAAGR